MHLKTRTMLITLWQKYTSLPEQHQVLKVTLNDTQFDNVEYNKLLGAHINNNLSWENNMNYILSALVILDVRDFQSPSSEMFKNL